jgi:DNA helicase IV
MSIESKKLDPSQYAAIKADNKRTRIIASAGSGKTLTILTSVVEDIRNGMNAREILLLSFNRDVKIQIIKRIKKIAELEKDLRIKDELLLLSDNQIHTFHSYCLNVLQNSKDRSEERKTLLGGGNLGLGAIDTIIHLKILKNKNDSKLLREFFANYLNVDTGDQKLYKVSKSKTTDKILFFAKTIRTHVPYIVNGEEKKLNVRSYEEKIIAEWLYAHRFNFIYEDSNNRPDGYPGIPDFHIVLSTLDKDKNPKKIHIYYEHFGLNDKYQPNPKYSQEDQKKYLDSYKTKMNFINNDKNQKYIITYSYDFDHRNNNLFDKISKVIKDTIEQYDVKLIDNQFIKKNDEEYFKDIKDNNSSDFIKFSRLISSFMENYRIRELKDKIILSKIDNLDEYEKRRCLIFYDIYKKIYNYYEQLKNDESKRDFTDMLVFGKDFIEDTGIKKLVVDEFQDMSDLRIKVCQKILEKNNSKCLVVGDDAQSIYAFTGSRVEFIGISFDENLGESSLVHLKKTYRFSTAMADLSTAFIMQNENQIPKKDLTGVKQSLNLIPLQLITTGKNYRYSFKLRYSIIKKLEALFKIDKNIKKILFLSRYQPQTYKFEYGRYESFQDELNRIFKSKKHIFSFQTIHKSKGDESDYVFLMHVKSEKYSFPSTIKDDKVLDLVKEENKNHEEERRVFYVAITRAQKKVFMYTDNENDFFKEILKLSLIKENKHYQIKQLENISKPMVNISVAYIDSKHVKDLNRGDRLISIDDKVFDEEYDINRYIRKENKSMISCIFARKDIRIPIDLPILKETTPNGLVKYNLPVKFKRNENNKFIRKLEEKYNNQPSKVEKRIIYKDSLDKKNIINKKLDKIQRIRKEIQVNFQLDIVIIQRSRYFQILEEDALLFSKEKSYNLHQPNPKSNYLRCTPMASDVIQKSIIRFLESKNCSYAILRQIPDTDPMKRKIVSSSNEAALGYIT